MRFSERTTREYVEIYDTFYEKFRKQMGKYRVSNSRKVQVIDKILSEMDVAQANVLKLMLHYRSYANTLSVVSKQTGIPKKRIHGLYEIAVRHMYEPLNIELAVPSYYPKPTTSNEELTPLTKADFGNNALTLSQLQNKSGIYYREQLMKHLSNGWFYLTTIPGCGSASRIRILTAIDKWEGKGIEV